MSAIVVSRRGRALRLGWKQSSVLLQSGQTFEIMSHKIYWVRNTSSRAVEADRTIELNADADRPRRSAQFALSNWVQLRYLMIVLGRLIRVSSSLSRYCRVADLRCNGL